ncbi:hypothetical protein GCM10010409_07920 [Mycolicibacterium diernhoferi]
MKFVGVLIGGALAAGALFGAGAAQAAPFELIDNPSPHVKPVKDADGKIIGWHNTNPSPWDFTNDVIKLPIGNIKFTGADRWESNYGGSMGPRGADRDRPRRVGD